MVASQFLRSHFLWPFFKYGVVSLRKFFYVSSKIHCIVIYKKSVINNLVDRAILLSDKKFKKNNLKLITDTLEDNDSHLVSYKTLLTRVILPLNKKHD